MNTPGLGDRRRQARVRTAAYGAAMIVVATASSTIAAEAFAPNRAGDHFISVPVAGLAAGEYLLRVEASAGAYSAGRAVRFRIR